MNLTWSADSSKSKQTYYLFDNMHAHTFGDVAPVAGIYMCIYLCMCVCIYMI